MTKNMQGTLVIEKEILISLMADAYGQGLKAGQNSASMKDNPEFVLDAVRLFSNGLSDMLSDLAGSTEQ